MLPGLIPRPVVTVIATVVIAVWALAQAAEIFVPTYDAPPEIHLAVMLVLGAVYGVRKADQKDDDEDDEPAPAAAPPAPAAAALPVVDEPSLPPGRVSAADLIARIQQERDQG